MTKTITLSEVRQGEILSLAGERFARLSEDEDGAILVVREDVLPEMCLFEDLDAERNSFLGSRLAIKMTEWLPLDLRDASVIRPIDLTTLDGMTDYGTPELRLRALTVMEYQRYRRYIPLASAAWWTATGWTTASSPMDNAVSAYLIGDKGAVLLAHIGKHAYPRPALYLKSDTVVTVEREDEDGKTGLAAYTELELLEELRRRAQLAEEASNDDK